MENRPTCKERPYPKQTNNAVQNSALLTVQSRNQNSASSRSHSMNPGQRTTPGVSGRMCCRGPEIRGSGTHEERVQGLKVRAAVCLLWLFCLFLALPTPRTHTVRHLAQRRLQGTWSHCVPAGPSRRTAFPWWKLAYCKTHQSSHSCGVTSLPVCLPDSLPRSW